MSNLKEGYSVKVILIGDGGTGKTSLVNRFVHRKFSRLYKTTIGVDITPCRARIKDTGEVIRFVLWDMSGQTHFERFRTRFYTGTSGALVVYDLTSANSYRTIPSWIKECNDNCRKIVPKMIVGNKADLKDLIIKQTRPPSSELKIPTTTTSAKENWNVDEVFLSLFEVITGKSLEKIEDHEPVTTHVSYDSKNDS
ncbi:MAG: Rab family GTPase [Candidatus Hodarchaeota archaeon]